SSNLSGRARKIRDFPCVATDQREGVEAQKPNKSGEKSANHAANSRTESRTCLDRSLCVRGRAAHGEKGTDSVTRARDPHRGADVDERSLSQLSVASKNFWDNARCNLDRAIAELYRAYGAGYLSETECAAIDTELRGHQRKALGKGPIRHLGGVK